MAAMQALIVVWLFALTVYVWYSNQSMRNKVKALLHGHSALFWALKNKKLIDMDDWKEGNKVAKGEKAGDMSLRDFIDLSKS
jgi:hypothetical protein